MPAHITANEIDGRQAGEQAGRQPSTVPGRPERRWATSVWEAALRDRSEDTQLSEKGIVRLCADVGCTAVSVVSGTSYSETVQHTTHCTALAMDGWLDGLMD